MIAATVPFVIITIQIIVSKKSNKKLEERRYAASYAALLFYVKKLNNVIDDSSLLGKDPSRPTRNISFEINQVLKELVVISKRIDKIDETKFINYSFEEFIIIKDSIENIISLLVKLDREHTQTNPLYNYVTLSMDVGKLRLKIKDNLDKMI